MLIWNVHQQEEALRTSYSSEEEDDGPRVMSAFSSAPKGKKKA